MQGSAQAPERASLLPAPAVVIHYRPLGKLAAQAAPLTTAVAPVTQCLDHTPKDRLRGTSSTDMVPCQWEAVSNC
jgi:hypothetical protein